MEPTNLETKYQKLATEYSKLRAQASVLKKAVIEEQNKNSAFRDTLRQKETALRRSEQEVDSLGFRNKQLEHRVASLQEDFEKEYKKSNKNQKGNNKNKTTQPNVSANISSSSGSDYLVFEELQKKIMENAQLTSLIDDKDRELDMHYERIQELEKQIKTRTTESSDLEKKLRRENEMLSSRNSELETKLVEAASMLGSEDALSVSGSEHIPLNATNHATSSEERIAILEKEVVHWRTQYEISKIADMNCNLPNSSKTRNDSLLCGTSCSSAATGVVVPDSDVMQPNTATIDIVTKEQILFNSFSKKFEDLLRAKCVAESRVVSYIIECENLQHCLQGATEDIKLRDLKLQEACRCSQTLEEDLATTRINYEEQISVLTEQVISLSEQLAACK